MIKTEMLKHNRIVTISQFGDRITDVYWNGRYVGNIGNEDAIDALMKVAHLSDGRPLIGYNLLIPYNYSAASDEDAATIANYFSFRADLTESMELNLFNQDWAMLADQMREVDLGFAVWYN